MRYNIVLLIITFYCMLVNGSVYYVSTNGNNSNNGSISTPWQTIQYGLSNTIAGDTLTILQGYYNEHANTINNGDSYSLITINGSNMPIILDVVLSNNNYNVYGVTFGASTGTRSKVINILGNNVTISNCLINANNNDAITGIAIVGTNNILTATTIQSVTNGTACSIVGDSNFVIKCALKDSGDSDSFRIWGRYNTIDGNIVTNYVYNNGINHADFVQTFGEAGVQSRDIVLKNNIVINSRIQICNLESGNRSDIRDWYFINNIFSNVTSSAFIRMTNTYFLNNMFIVSGTNNNHPIMLYAEGSGSVIVNNGFIGCGNMPDQYGQHGWYGIASGPPEYYKSNNYVCGTSPGYASKDIAYLTESNKVNGGDPSITYQPDGKYIISSDSILIGKGANLSSIFTTDILGNPRGSSWDIGAYQYTNSSPIVIPTNVQSQRLFRWTL